MYLVSLYFDEKTNNIIQNYINHVAEKTGNTFMAEGKVPPHMTVLAFETKNEEQVMEVLEKVIAELKKGRFQLVAVGEFFPQVIYLVPVLNEYLHTISRKLYDSMKGIEDTKMSPYYRPFQWLPHVTIGKQLSKEQMEQAFLTMQSEFSICEGEVVKIGVAKTNPYRDIFIKKV